MLFKTTGKLVNIPKAGNTFGFLWSIGIPFLLFVIATIFTPELTLQ